MQRVAQRLNEDTPGSYIALFRPARML
jgi:hypothetical protein